MSGALSLPHLLLIGIVALVLFGKGKVSSIMGEAGKGITAFRKGLDEGRRETDASPLLLTRDNMHSGTATQEAPAGAVSDRAR